MLFLLLQMDEAPRLCEKSEPVTDSCSLETVTEALRQAEYNYLFVGAPHIKNFITPKEKCSDFFRVQVSNVSSACLEEYAEKLDQGEIAIEHSRFNSVLSLLICVVALCSLIKSGVSVSGTTQFMAFSLFCMSIFALGYFSFASSWTNRKTSFLYLISRELRRRNGGGGPFTPILTDG